MTLRTILLSWLATLTLLCAAFPAHADRAAASPAGLESYQTRLGQLSTDSLFRLGTRYLERTPAAADSAMLCFMTATRRLPQADGNRDELRVIAKTLVNTSHIYSDIFCDVTEAYRYLRQAEEICLANDFRHILSYVYLNMGVAYSTSSILKSSRHPGSELPDEALEYLGKAFDIARQVSAYEVMGYALFNLIDASPDLEHPVTLEYAHRYLEAGVPDSEPSRPYMTALSQGIVSLHERDFPAALRHFESMNASESVFGMASRRMNEEAQLLRALTCEAAGDTARARVLMLDIRNRAMERDDLTSQLWIAGNLYMHYLREEDMAMADAYLLSYYKIKELYAARGGNDATITEDQLRKTVKDYEAAMLVADMEARRDRMLIVVGGLLSLSVILILSLSLYFSRKKRGYINALYRRNMSHALPLPDAPSDHEAPISLTVASSTPEAAESAPDSGSSAAVREQDALLAERILQTLASDREVFTPDYSMSALCSRLGASPTYVSRAINSCLGKSFKTLLAEMRVREACRLLDDPAVNSGYTIEAVCNEVGFRSRAAFSVAFKNVTGLTPTEYRKAARRYMPQTSAPG